MEPAHNEVLRLFNLAFEAPPDQRETLLAKECEDSELKARVLAMVAAAEDDRFLTSPTNAGLEKSGAPDPDATVVNNPNEQPGEQIGHYKLLQQIGEGGFGTVWMAEQKEPVRRRVALKVIKLGMDTKQVIARFEAERQALAMMDHPNIARVFDAGSTDSGRPFFVMEYIKGVPIVEYCDTKKLDTKERLDLFTTTCHAIQHAHQKGIIHRDIKPSNVLVTLHDGEPVPKVIDFGIAKATNAELTNKTLFTEHHQMVGTPTYMSPEQAEMSGLDIDTRADIYSLGVLLYELLTGTTPFDSRSLMAAGYAEMMRIIREDEPHRPSTRLSSLGDLGTRTAQLRHTSLKKLSMVLRGDLDWIVMKCLEKDRARRYDTATGLAADILRHQSDEPVVAGPPSKAYKLQKFMKRNRRKVIMGAVVAALLVLGIVGTSTAWVRAMRAEQDALEQRDVADAERKLTASALAEKEIALDKKEVALRRTRVLGLAIASAEAANHDPMRGLLLAREAGRTWMLPSVVTQLHSAIQGSLERVVLLGHEDSVMSAIFSPSGDRILTASDDKTARLWDLRGRELAVLRGHESTVRSAVFSPSGDRILTSMGLRDRGEPTGGDKTARLWDLQGKELALFRHDDRVVSAVFSPSGDRILTASEDTTARLWDLQGRELAVFRGHEGPLFTAAFSPSGDRILTFAIDHTARLWDTAGNELAVLRGHDGLVSAAVFSPAGDQILTVSLDKTARLWNLDGQELVVLEHEAFVVRAAFSPSGDRVVTAADRTAVLWNTEGEKLVVFRGHEAPVLSAKFSPSGDRILTFAIDHTARLWDTAGNELAAFRGHESYIVSAAFSPLGDRILTASLDRTARLWDVERKELAVLRGHANHIWSAVFSPSGNRVVTASHDKTARLWTSEGTELAVLRGHEDAVAFASFSPSGDRIVSSSWDKTARLWNLEGKELAVLRGHESFVESAVFSPSGDRILTGSRDKTMRLWDLEGKELAVFRGNDDLIWTAVFSHSGDRILTTSDKAAKLWDLQGNQLAVIGGHEALVASAAFSPSDDKILTASQDMTARCWDLDGNELAVLRGHESILESAVFSPSGDRILTAAHDGTARLWDLEGNELTVLRGHPSQVFHATFSPSGDRIITASVDGTARIWLTDGDDLLELADERVSRELTQDERRRYADLLGDR